MTPLVQPVNRTLEAAFLRCHSTGHEWRHEPGVIDPSQAEPGMRAPWGSGTSVGERSRCVSCTGERVRWYTRSGEVINKYRMADGYYHNSRIDDEPAPSKLEWRKRLVVTLFDDFVETVEQAPRKRQARKAAAS